MIDFAKVGEAAFSEYLQHGHDGFALPANTVCERIGRAAVGAMIPEAATHAHLGLVGICHPDCPFHRNDEQSGYTCTVDLGEIARKPEYHMRPGPSCPAHKEAKP